MALVMGTSGARAVGNGKGGEGGALKRAHHIASEAIDLALACERHERHLAGGSGLEAHRRSRRNVEAHATRLFPARSEGGIGLVEMIVAADLDRPVAGLATVSVTRALSALSTIRRVCVNSPPRHVVRVQARE